jgi:CubicO group peptidase (beta-lactamase class C family)
VHATLERGKRLSGITNEEYDVAQTTFVRRATGPPGRLNEAVSIGVDPDRQNVRTRSCDPCDGRTIACPKIEDGPLVAAATLVELSDVQLGQLTSNDHAHAARIIAHATTTELELRAVSTPEEWASPAAFPSGAGGLVSTVDDFLAFARLLLNKGAHDGQRLVSEKSVALMTASHLTPDQIAGGGILLGGRGWGFGMGVVSEADAEWPVPGRYGWSGGYGTAWFNDPHRGIVAIAMTQVSDFLWNGGLDEFEKLVAAI